MKTNVTPGKTPGKITVSMIDQDLKDGISKSEMTIKYGIKPWEVDEMFKHPFLKGRRPSKKKPLSFVFEDDISEQKDTMSIEDIKEAKEEITDALTELVTPITNDIETLVEESEWTAEDSETGEAIELDQGAQEMLEECLDTMVNEDGETLRETFNKEIKEEMEEEDLEIEVEDDTFDL